MVSNETHRKGYTRKMDTLEMMGRINNFYRTDFREGIRELTIYDNKRSILNAQKEFDGKTIGFYKMECSTLVEVNDDEPIKYGLKIQFDKL